MNINKSIGLFVLTFTSALSNPAHSENIDLISRFGAGPFGGPGGNLPSFSPAVNGNGSVIVFESAADSQVTGNVSSMHDIMVYNSAGDTLVNLTLGGNNHSGQPDISSDGRYIAFKSTASNLHDDDANGSVVNLYLYDRELNQLEIVTPNQNSGSFTRASAQPNPATVRISGDGGYIAFNSSATNLTNDTDNSTSPLYLWERETNEFVSVMAGADSGALPGLDISEDGSWLVFSSFATNLTDDAIADETVSSLFIYNTADGSFTRLPETQGGRSPSISGDGRYVAYTSDIDGRPSPSGAGAINDVYLLDRMTGDRRLVTANGDNSSWSPSLSADGGQLTFRSQANNLLPNDENGNWDIFVYETDTGVLQQITEDSNGINIQPAISGDGNTVSFASAATNLIAEGEVSRTIEAYVWRRDGEVPVQCDLLPAGVLRSTSGASIEVLGASECPSLELVNMGAAGPRGMTIPGERGRSALNLTPNNQSDLPDGDFIFYRYPLLDGSDVYVADFEDQNFGYPVTMSFRTSNLREFELLELAVFRDASRSREQLIYVEHGSSWSFEAGEPTVLASIEGLLFVDNNDNSVRDPGEQVFQETPTAVTLFYCGDRDGIVSSRGFREGVEMQFSFTGLEPGMYQMGVRLGDSYRFTFGGFNEDGESLQPIRAVSGPPNQLGFTDCVLYGSGAEANVEMGVILRE